MRTTKGSARNKAKNRLFKKTKGFTGGRGTLLRSAKETLVRAEAYAFRDRRVVEEVLEHRQQRSADRLLDVLERDPESRLGRDRDEAGRSLVKEVTVEPARRTDRVSNRQTVHVGSRFRPSLGKPVDVATRATGGTVRSSRHATSCRE